MTLWQNIPKQTVMTDDALKRHGDCWRCCIAAVIGVPAETVPHFVQEAEGTTGDPDAATQRWLNERGYVLMRVRPAGVWFPAVWSEPVWKDGIGTRTVTSLQLPVITCGPTPRSCRPGQHHAVVMYRGKMVYDPHPDNSGLTYEVEQYVVVLAPKEAA